MNWMLCIAALCALTLLPARGAGPPAGLLNGPPGDPPIDQEPPDVACLGDNEICPGGDCHTNGDGVTVCLGAGSRRPASMSPGDGEGHPGSVTTVTLRKSSKDATVSGLDGNDSVQVQDNSTGNISGEGGTVCLGKGCTFTVTCNETKNATSIRVNLEVGGQVIVHPGGSVTIGT